MTAQRPKVCVIGFQKTGTTSVAKALRILGCKTGQATARIAKDVDWTIADPSELIADIALDVLDGHDAVSDSPYCFVYDQVDARFAGTKFILTTRSFESWLTSYRNFFPDGNNKLRRWMYGVDRLTGHEPRYKAVYEGQNAAIRAYFKDRPDDFIEMNLSQGDGWQELVAFLGPSHLPPFPHMNRNAGP